MTVFDTVKHGISHFKTRPFVHQYVAKHDINMADATTGNLFHHFYPAKPKWTNDAQTAVCAYNLT